MLHVARPPARLRLVLLHLCVTLLLPLSLGRGAAQDRPPGTPAATVTESETVAGTPPAIAAASPVALPVGATAVYADPDGRFTVPVPIGWTAAPQDDYVLLQDPEQAIAIAILAWETPDLHRAIAEGWRRVAPGVARPPGNPIALPVPPGLDDLVALEYDNGAASGRIVQALGFLTGETSVVLLFDGDAGAAGRRSSQVNLVVFGLDFPSVARLDLSGQAPAPFSDQLLADFTTYVENELADFGIPGAAIAIVQDGEVVYRQGFGVRVLGGDDPVTPDSLMMAGSITKSMTTMMMGTLVDDGIIAWDTPAQQIWPEFAVADPALSSTVTLRNLVCACTGVPRRDLELAFNADQLSAEAMLRSLAGFAFFTPIGEAFQYSNQMVAAGGYLAALAAGGSLADVDQDYVALMQARILDPIGMPASTFTVNVDPPPANIAIGHQRANDGELSVETPGIERLFDPVKPAVGLWTTADDLARYLMTLLAAGAGPDGTRVVSAANLDETLIPQVAVDGVVSYGLGWFIDSYHGQRVISHDGNTHGYTANLTFLPEANFGIVVLTNAQQVNLFTDAVRWHLIELAFEQEPVQDELVDQALAAWRNQVAYTIASIGPAPAASTVAPLLGTYTNPALGVVQLVYADQKFWLDAGEFRSELRPLRGAAAASGDYIGFDSLAASHLVTVDTSGREPAWTLTSIIDGEDYPFIWRGEATAAATPLASPSP